MAAVTEERIADLPAPVQGALRSGGVVGRQIPTTVSLSQRGEILIGGRWLPFTADEDYRLDPPSFRWRAVVRRAGLPIARASDALAADGRGQMRVRLFGLIPVVDASGLEMDQGALMRWLNETMWFPQVWATDIVSWTPIDERSAAGSVSAGGLTARAEFRFDGDDRLVDFHADRYRSVDGGFELRPWSTPITAHRRFDGLTVPAAGRALWELDDEELEYIRLEILDLTYA